MFTLHPRALRHASSELVRHGLDVDDEARIPLPDTGRSDCPTQDGLDRLLTTTVDAARRVRDLGETLERVLSSSLLVDDEVGRTFTVLGREAS